MLDKVERVGPASVRSAVEVRRPPSLVKLIGKSKRQAIGFSDGRRLIGGISTASQVEQLATIDELAEMLGLKTKPYNVAQIRCACPVHGGDEKTLAISPGVRSKRGSPGVFFCQKAKSGGDRIGLIAHCMDIGQQDAAFFIAEQFGTQNSTEESSVNSQYCQQKRATVPQNPERRKQPASPSREFDPAAFAAKLAFTDEVAELGITEEDATRLQIGFTRGKVYFPVRNEDGSISGFIGYADGELKFPPQWIGTNVVKLKRAQPTL